MADFTYRAAERHELPSLTAWIVDLCRTPTQHCLHSWAGEAPDSLAKQLQRYLDQGELSYLVAQQGEVLVGAAGAEFDEELGRGWLHGPHAAPGSWGSVAGELLRRLVSALPAGIGRLDAYVNCENVRAHRLYHESGFQDGVKSFDYRLRRRPSELPRSRFPDSLTEAQEAAFVELYQTLFPRAYYSGERILRMIGDSHHVFVAGRGSEVLGFAIAEISESADSAEVQFVGVRPEDRGKGLGRDLLLSVAHWLFDQPGMTEVSLNVLEELAGARALYESVGFELRFAGIGMHGTRSRIEGSLGRPEDSSPGRPEDSSPGRPEDSSPGGQQRQEGP